MKKGILASSAAFLLLVALFANPAQGETVTLHADDFAYITTGNSTSTSGSGTTFTGAGIYVVTNAYQAGGAVRLAKSGAVGSLTTTNLVVEAGTLIVGVDAKGWNSDEKIFYISVASQSSTINCAYDMSGVFETFTRSFTVEEGAVAVTFHTPSSKRVFLDNVHIYQEFFGSGEPEFAVTMQSPSIVDELTPVQFTIDASVDGNPTNVAYASGLPAGASYSYTNSVFTWTPALGQAGIYGLVFSARGADGQLYTQTVTITVNELPLAAPQNLAASNIAYNAFDLSWDAVPAASQGYVVSVWTGSGATDTPAADAEPFYEIAAGGSIRAPYGWAFTGVTEKYATTDYVELKFDGVGDVIVTKAYPKPVASLAFNLRGWSTSDLSNNVVRVYGTPDDATWTALQTYNTLADQDGDAENNIVTSGDLEKNLVLSLASGYRRFKFVYEADERGNVGIGNIAVVYDGCGTRFIGDWNGKATTSLSAAVDGARAGRDHYVLVGARDDAETKHSLLGLATPDAPRETLVVVR